MIVSLDGISKKDESAKNTAPFEHLVLNVLKYAPHCALTKNGDSAIENTNSHGSIFFII